MEILQISVYTTSCPVFPLHRLFSHSHSLNLYVSVCNRGEQKMNKNNDNNNNEKGHGGIAQARTKKSWLNRAFPISLRRSSVVNNTSFRRQLSDSLSAPPLHSVTTIYIRFFFFFYLSFVSNNPIESNPCRRTVIVRGSLYRNLFLRFSRQIAYADFR